MVQVAMVLLLGAVDGGFHGPSPATLKGQVFYEDLHISAADDVYSFDDDPPRNSVTFMSDTEVMLGRHDWYELYRFTSSTTEAGYELTLTPVAEHAFFNVPTSDADDAPDPSADKGPFVVSWRWFDRDRIDFNGGSLIDGVFTRHTPEPWQAVDKDVKSLLKTQLPRGPYADADGQTLFTLKQGGVVEWAPDVSPGTFSSCFLDCSDAARWRVCLRYDKRSYVFIEEEKSKRIIGPSVMSGTLCHQRQVNETPGLQGPRIEHAAPKVLVKWRERHTWAR